MNTKQAKLRLIEDSIETANKRLTGKQFNEADKENARRLLRMLKRKKKEIERE